MTQASLQLAVVVSELFAENAYIAHLKDRSDCLVFDPGFDADQIIGYLEQTELTPAAILNTHGHADHIAGNQALKEHWPDCPLVIGSGDAAKLTDPVANLSAGYGFSLTSPAADVMLNDGDTYHAAGLELEVRETPGHSCGHVIFIHRSEGACYVFGGDVLFQGSVGRTDFADGSMEQLRQSIHDKLFTLPDDTIVLPGHGPHTTVGQEKRLNPYVAL